VLIDNENENSRPGQDCCSRQQAVLGVMGEFEAVARADDLKQGEMQAFDVRATQLAVANVAGELRMRATG
jgi:hypothetical protein